MSADVSIQLIKCAVTFLLQCTSCFSCSFTIFYCKSGYPLGHDLTVIKYKYIISCICNTETIYPTNIGGIKIYNTGGG